MALVIKTNGFKSSKDKVIGCAAHLTHEDNLGRSATRYLSFPLMEGSAPLAELTAARIGLSSIKESVREDKTLLYASEYVTRMLKTDRDGEYSTKARQNAEEVAALRELFESFADISVADYSSEALEQVTADARTAAETRQTTDTGSLIVAEAKADYK